MRSIPWAVVGLFVGCTCGDIGVKGRQYACASDQDCAAAYVCVSGLCVLPGADGGPNDAGAQDGGSVDAGFSDGSPLDAGHLDAATKDSGTDAASTGADAGSTDGGFIELTDGGGCVQFTSLAQNPATGNPAVAFAQGTDILYAECTSGCYSNPQWTSPQIVQANAVSACAEPFEQITLLFLPNGEPAVGYVDNVAATCPVKYAVRTSTGLWAIASVGPTNNCGVGSHRPSSMALVGDGGIPAIAYHGVSSTGASDLDYATCQSGCESGLLPAWTIQVAATAASSLGFAVAMASDPSTGLPRIAYYNGTETDFATCTNSGNGFCSNSTGTWSSGVLDATSSAGHLSVAFPASGTVPIVAYTKTTTGALTLATCTGNCANATTATWMTTTLDATLAAANASTNYLQLLVDKNDVARVAYTNTANHTLEYAIGTAAPLVVDRNVLDGRLSFILSAQGSDFAYSMGPTLRYYPTTY